mgnify:CR=1 FL=1
MTHFFNFQTGTSVNPLEKITHFFINPYMADNFKLLKLAERITNNEIAEEDVMVAPLKTGHVVTMFAIKHLVEDTAMVKWTASNKFQVHAKSGRIIYCHVVTDEAIRIDTILG